MTEAGLALLLVLMLGSGGCDWPRAALSPPSTGIPLRPTTATLRLQAAHDGASFYLRIRWTSSALAAPAYFRYTQGQWVEEVGDFRQRAEDGEPPLPLGEVALTVALSARGAASEVRDFDRIGCFAACHDSSNEMPNWLPSDGDVTMHLLPSFGGPADLWVWRAGRTAPAGVADDEALSIGGQIDDAGNAPWQDLDLTDNAPPFVFDPAGTGAFAQLFAEVLAGAPLSFSDGSLPGPHALPYAEAITRGYVPMEGDAVPAQLLSQPSGSRADVGATASYDGQSWDLRLVRALHTSDSANDVGLDSGGTYDLAFALHTGGAAGRDHYVSLPVALTLAGQSATFGGATSAPGPPDFSDEATYPSIDVAAFLPGITSYEFVVGAVVTRQGALRANDVLHGGWLEVSSGTHGCAECHRVRSSDPAPPFEQVGALEQLVLRRGGVFGPTPQFEAAQ